MTASWLSAAECDVNELASLVEVDTALTDYPTALAVIENVVVYTTAGLTEGLRADRRSVLGELQRCLHDGPGVLVIRNVIEPAVLDRASSLFEGLIEEQMNSSRSAGDHFAKPGANDRIWNSLEKHCLADPEGFADYFANPVVDAVCTAWLGPGYQMTAQVNVVNPGADAQEPHRDYHLGFMEEEEAEAYPAPIHRLSPLLTLQAAVAHCDMPVETGPTLYLPHSQKYEAGYVAWRRDDFTAYFAGHHRQLPLQKGDVILFNPAVLHAAGSNQTADIRRMANLFQVSSAFGRSLEAVNRAAMVDALYPVLLRWKQEGRSGEDINAVIAASAEGYPFPGDLDQKQPTGQLKPPAPAALLRAALDAESLAPALPR